MSLKSRPAEQDEVQAAHDESKHRDESGTK